MRPKIFLCPRFSKVGTDFWYLVKLITIFYHGSWGRGKGTKGILKLISAISSIENLRKNVSAVKTHSFKGRIGGVC